MHEQNGQDVAGEIFLADIARSEVFNQPETAEREGRKKRSRNSSIAPRISWKMGSLSP